MRKILLIMLCMVLLAGIVGAADYKFQNKSGSDLMIIHGDSANVTITGNVTASSGFFSWLGSLLNRITTLFVQDIDFSGMINGSGAINTTGNITADYFFGDGSQLDNLPSGTDGALNSSSWNRSGTDVFLHHTGDSVGIGTTSPGAPLEIRKATSPALSPMLILNRTDGGGGGTIKFGGEANQGILGIDNNGHLVLASIGQSTFDILFHTRAVSDGMTLTNERMRITDTGEVGIGTSNPTHELNVVGDLNVTGDIWSQGINISKNWTKEVYDIWNADWSGAAGLFRTDGWTVYNLTANVSIGTATSEYRFQTIGNVNLSNTLFVNGTDGSVGIGTATPSGLFNVADATDSNKFVVKNGSVTDSIKIDTSGGIDIDYDKGVWFSGDGDFNINTIATSGKLSSNMIEGIELFGESGNAFMKLAITNEDAEMYGWSGVKFTSQSGNMTLDGSGNVGIGTANPGELLEVAGNINSTGGDICITGGNCLSSVGGVTDGALNSSGWNRSGTDVFLANTGDNVGIGTLNPAEKLEVEGDIMIQSVGPRLFFNDTGASATEQIWGILADNAVLSFQAINDDYGGREASETWLQVERTGTNVGEVSFLSTLVGIGTENPGELLEVAGNINSTGGDICITGGNCLSDMGAGGGGLWRTDGWTVYNLTANVSIGTATSDYRFQTIGNVNLSNTLFVNGTDGSVGVGTDSPSDKLDVDGNARFTDATNEIWIGKNADMPTGAGLYLLGDGQSGIVRTYYDTTNLTLQAGETAGFESKIILGAKSGSDFIGLYTQSSERMRIDGGGNVGIGTTSPQQTLHVVGTFNTTSAGSSLVIDANGNVRIGI